MDQNAVTPMGNHLDLFQHIYRDWDGEAYYLTHKAMEDGPTWNTFEIKEKFDAIRAYFDGGVSNEEDTHVKNRVGAG